MSSSPKLILKRTEPSELVKEFTEFYCNLIPNLYNVKCPKFLDDVKNSLKDIRRLKHDIDLRHGRDFYIDLKYEEPSVRCAYMYAYNVLNTAIVYNEFLKYLNNNETVISKLSKDTLRICCLAGGAGTEAVGVIKAIFDVISKSSCETGTCLDVHVTVVDVVSEWETDGQALFDALKKASQIFGSKQVKFFYSFLKADLTCPFNKTLNSTIAKADIITIVKFGSSIEERSATVYVSCLENMIKDVIGRMTGRRCLFMLDVAGGKIFRHTMNVISTQPNKYRMQFSLHKKYRLMPKTLQKMESCINFRNVAEASTLFPTGLTTVSSCFWVKGQKNSREKNSTNVKQTSLK